MSYAGSRRAFSRRSLLLGASAATVAAAGLGGAKALAGDADRGLIDLWSGSDPFLRRKLARNSTVMQSFAFDDVNEHLYVVQVMHGDVQLSRERRPVPWEERKLNGDLCLTKLDYDGRELGYMYLKGFGHGVSFGVHPDGDDVHIWTETDANPDTGYGRAIARFEFADKQALEYGADTVEVHRPKPGSTSNRPAVDVEGSRLLLSYRADGSVDPDETFYAVYDLDGFRRCLYEPVYEFRRPGIEADDQFQGAALHGDFVYQLVGSPYSDPDGDNPPAGRGNAVLTAVDVTTGEVVQQAVTHAAHSLPFREPQGLSVQLTDPPRLHMGFASGVSGARDFSLYYKEG